MNESNILLQLLPYLLTPITAIINADTDLTAKVTAAITAGWSIIYQTR